MVLALGACAHTMPDEPAPKQRRRGGGESGRVKLAILPVESDAFPRLAAGLNAMLHDVQLKGVDDYFLSKVTLDVVQLSIECNDKSNSCFTQVGRSMDAQRVLLALIAPQGAARRKKRPVKVSVMLFNVDDGQPQHQSSKEYDSEEDASSGLPSLMQEAIGEFTVSRKTAGAK